MRILILMMFLVMCVGNARPTQGNTPQTTAQEDEILQNKRIMEQLAGEIVAALERFTEFQQSQTAEYPYPISTMESDAINHIAATVKDIFDPTKEKIQEAINEAMEPRDFVMTFLIELENLLRKREVAHRPKHMNRKWVLQAVIDQICSNIKGFANQIGEKRSKEERKLLSQGLLNAYLMNWKAGQVPIVFNQNTQKVEWTKEGQAKQYTKESTEHSIMGALYAELGLGSVRFKEDAEVKTYEIPTKSSDWWNDATTYFSNFFKTDRK